jgi:hypothetical protein
MRRHGLDLWESGISHFWNGMLFAALVGGGICRRSDLWCCGETCSSYTKWAWLESSSENDCTFCSSFICRPAHLHFALLLADDTSTAPCHARRFTCTEPPCTHANCDHNSTTSPTLSACSQPTTPPPPWRSTPARTTSPARRQAPPLRPRPL